MGRQSPTKICRRAGRGEVRAQMWQRHLHGRDGVVAAVVQEHDLHGQLVVVDELELGEVHLPPRRAAVLFIETAWAV